MVAFIDAHRETYGVEPICAQLPIAPSTYYEAKARQADPARRPARTQRDTGLRDAITRVWRDNRRVYDGRSAGSGRPELHGDAPQSAVGGRLYLCRDLAGHGVRRLRDRRVLAPDRRLAGDAPAQFPAIPDSQAQRPLFNRPVGCNDSLGGHGQVLEPQCPRLKSAARENKATPLKHAN